VVDLTMVRADGGFIIGELKRSPMTGEMTLLKPRGVLITPAPGAWV